MPVTCINCSCIILTLTNNLVNSWIDTWISLSFPWFLNYEKGWIKPYWSRAENQPQMGHKWSGEEQLSTRVSPKKKRKKKSKQNQTQQTNKQNNNKYISPAMSTTHSLALRSFPSQKSFTVTLNLVGLSKFFPSFFHICLHIFPYLPLQKGIPKLPMSFHIKVFLSSESFPSPNPPYTDYSNKTTKMTVVFGVMVQHCFMKTTKFSIFLMQINLHFLLNLNWVVTNNKILFPEVIQLTAF